MCNESKPDVTRRKVVSAEQIRDMGGLSEWLCQLA